MMRTRAFTIVAILVTALLAGCSASGEDMDPAAGRLSSLDPGDSALSAWRFDTAQTLGRLLVTKGNKTWISQPSGRKRTADVLAAALAIRSQRTYDIALPPKQSGLYAADEADPVFLTWLVIRYAAARPGFPVEELREALTKRLAGLAKPVEEADIEQSSTYLLARDSIAMLGGRSPVVPSIDYCARLSTSRNLITASVWVQFAHARGQRCSPAAMGRAVQFASERRDAHDGSLSDTTAAEIRAGTAILRLTGHPVMAPAVCPVLLTETGKDGIRTSRRPLTYLACVDANAAADKSVQPSSQVVTWLDLLVLTGGRLPEQEQIDAMGLLYETGALRLLDFRPDVIAAASGADVIGDPDDPVRSMLVSYARRQTPSKTPGTPDGSAALLFAAGALSKSACPSGDWLEAALRRTSDEADIDMQFRRAVVLTAAKRCGVRTPESATAKAISVATEVEAASRSRSAILDLWKAAEVRCLLEGRPGITPEGLRPLLPDYSLTRVDFDLSLDSLYASVRLSVMADSGCEGAFWQI